MSCVGSVPDLGPEHPRPADRHVRRAHL